MWNILGFDAAEYGVNRQTFWGLAVFARNVVQFVRCCVTSRPRSVYCHPRENIGLQCGLY